MSTPPPWVILLDSSLPKLWTYLSPVCRMAHDKLLIVFLLFLQHDLEGECSDNDSETTYIFECDFPECNSVSETRLYIF